MMNDLNLNELVSKIQKANNNTIKIKLNYIQKERLGIHCFTICGCFSTLASTRGNSDDDFVSVTSPTVLFSPLVAFSSSFSKTIF